MIINVKHIYVIKQLEFRSGFARQPGKKIVIKVIVPRIELLHLTSLGIMIRAQHKNCFKTC